MRPINSGCVHIQEDMCSLKIRLSYKRLNIELAQSHQPTSPDHKRTKNADLENHTTIRGRKSTNNWRNIVIPTTEVTMGRCNKLIALREGKDDSESSYAPLQGAPYS